MNYNHFTIEERCCLRECYVKGKSYREIAKLLGRNVSSVSRELKSIGVTRKASYFFYIKCVLYL